MMIGRTRRSSRALIIYVFILSWACVACGRLAAVFATGPAIIQAILHRCQPSTHARPRAQSRMTMDLLDNFPDILGGADRGCALWVSIWTLHCAAVNAVQKPLVCNMRASHSTQMMQRQPLFTTVASTLPHGQPMSSFALAPASPSCCCCHRHGSSPARTQPVVQCLQHAATNCIPSMTLSFPLAASSM